MAPQENPVERWRSFGWNTVETDGHDLEAVLDAFAAAKAHESQPTIIIARTIKGKGISYMENDFTWHSKPVTDDDLKQAQDELAAQEAAMTLSVTGQMLAQRDAFGDTLVELIDRDERVYVLDGDLANSTKADIVSRERPDRFLMMGIAEQNMMGVAAGMATCGLMPMAGSFACFIVNRDLDQLRVVVAQPNLPVKLCGAYSGLLTGKTGKTHQDVSDISVMRAMPNMTVLAQPTRSRSPHACAWPTTCPVPSTCV